MELNQGFVCGYNGEVDDTGMDSTVHFSAACVFWCTLPAEFKIQFSRAQIAGDDCFVHAHF